MSDSGQHSKKVRHTTPPDADSGANPTLRDLPSSSPPMPATKVKKPEPADIIIHSPLEGSVQLPLSDDDISRACANVRLSNPDFGQYLKNYGYTSVVDVAYMESRLKGYPFRDDNELRDPTGWRTPGACLLADPPIRLLQALLSGNLASMIAAGDQELGNYFKDNENFWTLREYGWFAPRIYVRILQDAAGNSPSPAQLFKVLDRLEKYASGEQEHDQMCAEIDQRNAASIRDDSTATSRATLIELSPSLRTCLSEVPPESHHLPFSQPLQYVGFSTNVQQQTTALNRTTGWLMPLFDAACKLEFQHPDKSAVFAFESYSVAYPVNWKECMLGEEIFARICKTYFYTGLGFNVEQAGLSIDVTILDYLPHMDAVEVWLTREQLRSANPVLDAQVRFDCEFKLPKWVKSLERNNKTPEEHQAAAQAAIDASIARYEAGGPTEETCLAAIEALEKKNREEESGIENERLRKALYEVHVKTERGLREKLGLSDE